MIPGAQPYHPCYEYTTQCGATLRQQTLGVVAGAMIARGEHLLADSPAEFARLAVMYTDELLVHEAQTAGGQ